MTEARAGRLQCRVCISPDAAIINRLLSSGSSLRAVSSQFESVSFQSVARHSKNCLGRRFHERQKPTSQGPRVPRILQAETSRVTEPLDLEAEVYEMVADAKEVAALAKQSGDLRLRILAAKELRPILEAVGKIKSMATTKDTDLRRKAYEVLASLPDSFVRGLRDGDATMLDAIENARPE
jgi:hypothetical protein